MNQIFEAAAELAIALEEGNFAYCFIGGLTELKEDPDIIPRLEHMMRKRGVL